MSLLYSTTLNIIGAFVFICVLLHIRTKGQLRRIANPHNLPLPPGPRPLPIIGNLWDIPKEQETATYFEWAERYGDLVHITVLGRHFLFVNSVQVATDLFEKRSANYSDRNDLPMLNDLCGWGWSFGHMPYGERWKKHRKLFHRLFQPSAAPKFWPIQTSTAHDLLRRLLHTPEDLMEHLRFNASQTIMKVTYGLDVSPKNDRYITIAEKALDAMAKAVTPGAFLVDIIPALKYVPAWMPGAGFQRQAREWKKVVLEMRDAPFLAVQNAMTQGTASPSFVSSLMGELDAQENVEEQMDTIKACAGLAYAGALPILPTTTQFALADLNRNLAGTESMVSALSSFILAMILYPDVAAKARRELDTVIGLERLPSLHDRCSLPYVDAVVKEVLRFSPVAPLGLPHMVTDDDHYNGYFIPKGTTIIGNTWAILHDKRTYCNPEKFDPDRFLANDKKENPVTLGPLTSAFGYGRRICPGRFMAEAQLWISIACILSVFEIGSGIDEEGRPVKPRAEFSSGMICHPLPFKFSIEPRGDAAELLIEQTLDAASLL